MNQYHAAPISLAAYDLSLWTAIAVKARPEDDWRVLEGSPMTIRESVVLEANGTLLRAHRRAVDGVAWELVVKTRSTR
jgi:hypothetical protein